MKNLFVFPFAFLFLFLVTLSSITVALAGPGAHGPNGEHLETPAAQSHVADGHRLEAVSEAFELVGNLQGGELSIVIDRFDTNTPVLGARLEVESEGRKALAKFHADHGDYAIDDQAFLQGLAKPGEHALVFTLITETESDLLQAVLEIDSVAAAHTAADAHGHVPRNWWLTGGVLAGLLAIGMAFFARARLHRRSRIGK